MKSVIFSLSFFRNKWKIPLIFLKNELFCPKKVFRILHIIHKYLIQLSKKTLIQEQKCTFILSFHVWECKNHMIKALIILTEVKFSTDLRIKNDFKKYAFLLIRSEENTTLVLKFLGKTN